MRQLELEAHRSERGGEGFVFGEGCPDATLMIVGEAPGPEEERKGRPFVGRAGELLNHLLGEAGIRREDVWITNIVKRYPTRVVDGRLTIRPPTAAEIRADRVWLDRELSVIQPQVILCLGATSASTLIHKGFRLWAEHGKWFEMPGGIMATATFHPAYILRQRGADRERLLELARQDFAAVR
jgi:DNA polymerase